AIIVVERVQYLMQYEHKNALESAIQAMKDIGGAIVATTLVLLSIFVPVGLMAGLTGKIYQQFAVTIATAVVFSAVNALTLSPALCAIFLRNSSPFAQHKRGRVSDRLFSRFNTFLSDAQNKYMAGVNWLIHRMKATLILSAVLISGIGFLFYVTPTSFIPQEDEGVIFADVQLPETAGLNRTNAVMKTLTEGILPLDGIRYVIAISGASLLGAGGENIGMGVVGLKNWSERTGAMLSLSAIMERLQQKFYSFAKAQVDFFALPSIPGVGSSSGLSFQINAVNPNISAETLAQKTDEFLIKMNQMPQFAEAFTTFSASTPHLFLDINRTKLESLGVPVSDFFAALQNNLGSRYVNDFTLAGQVNKVIIQAAADYRAQPADVENMYIRSDSGQMVQVKQFADLKTVMMPKIIYRYNMYLSAAVSAQTADSFTSGEGIKTIIKLAHDLGEDYAIAWTGLTLQEVETSGLAFILIALALVFGYLFLVALYESWLVAFSVIFSNIFAVAGALIGLHLMGLSLSIYAQLGLVLLIGLASKNAILIVEFILDHISAGQDELTAAKTGAAERFRAVLMTALTFILGVMPMVFATGAGAASQRAIGTAVFFGMILATTVGIIFVPAFFVLFYRLKPRQKKRNSVHKKGAVR
ncbi:MAG: efflux RND transporter permease subunit, partial [Alphaproteobacteria bacterium]